MFILIIHLILIIQCCVTLIWYLIDMVNAVFVIILRSFVNISTAATTNIIIMLLHMVVKLFMVQRDDFSVLCWWAPLIHFSYAI